MPEDSRETLASIIPIVDLKKGVSSRTATRSAHSSGASFDWSDAIGSSDYDPHTIYNASTKDGTSEKLVARVSPSTLGMIQAIVQSAKIPEYRTAQDLIRDALVHRLIFLAEHYEVPTSMQRVLAAEQVTNDARTSSLIRESSQGAVNLLREELDNLQRAGDQEGIRALRSRAWQRTLRLTEPYRGQMEEVLLQYGPRPLKLEEAAEEARQAAREGGEGEW